MTKQDFLSRLPKGVTIPNDQEYEIIEFVYKWHPSINSRGTGREGKNQIASLYSKFGMSIIFDMLETARKSKNIINLYFDTSHLTKKEIQKYLGDNRGYGWHISDLVIYDTPKELSEFGKIKPPQSWCYVD